MALSDQGHRMARWRLLTASDTAAPQWGRRARRTPQTDRVASGPTHRAEAYGRKRRAYAARAAVQFQAPALEASAPFIALFGDRRDLQPSRRTPSLRPEHPPHVRARRHQRVLAIGMTFVILTGGIDLSVGSILGLCGMVVGALIVIGLHLPLFGFIVYFHVVHHGIAVVAGALIGSVNGSSPRIKVAPFIATLGMLYVARGFALLCSDGSTFPFLVGKQSWALRASRSSAGSSWASRVIWLLLIVALPPPSRELHALRPPRLRRRRERARGIPFRGAGRASQDFVYMFSGFAAVSRPHRFLASSLRHIRPRVRRSNSTPLPPRCSAEPRCREAAARSAARSSALRHRNPVGRAGHGGGQLVLADGHQGVVIIVAVVVDQPQRRLQQRVALRQMARFGGS